MRATCARGSVRCRCSRGARPARGVRASGSWTGCRGIRHASWLALSPLRRIVLPPAAGAYRVSDGRVRVLALFGQWRHPVFLGHEPPAVAAPLVCGALEPFQRRVPGLLPGASAFCGFCRVRAGVDRHPCGFPPRQTVASVALVSFSQLRTSRSGSAHCGWSIRAITSRLNCWCRRSAVSRSVTASRMARASCPGPLPL